MKLTENDAQLMATLTTLTMAIFTNDTIAFDNELKTFIEHGFDLGYLQINLIMASCLGHLYMVKELWQSGVDVNVTDDIKIPEEFAIGVQFYKENLDPLLCAATNDHDDVVKFLLELQVGGDEVEAVFDEISLMFASLNKQQAATDILSTENLTEKEMEISKQLHSAVLRNSVDEVKNLTAELDDDNNERVVNSKNHLGYPPLYLTRNIDIVELLIDSGADVDYRTSSGFTALHRAAQTGHTDIVRILLSRGSDVNALAYGHLTPLDLAKCFSLNDLELSFLLIKNKGRSNLNHYNVSCVKDGGLIQSVDLTSTLAALVNKKLDKEMEKCE